MNDVICCHNGPDGTWRWQHRRRRRAEARSQTFQRIRQRAPRRLTLSSYIMVSNCELWRSMLSTIALFRSVCCWRLGNVFLGDRYKITVRPMLRDRCLSCLSLTLVYCGQTVGWIKPLGTELGLGPGNIVLDVDQAPPTKRGTAAPTLLGPCLLWPNGRPSQQLLSSCLTKRRRSVPEIVQIDSGFLAFRGRPSSLAPVFGSPCKCPQSRPT